MLITIIGFPLLLGDWADDDAPCLETRDQCASIACDRKPTWAAKQLKSQIDAESEAA